MNRLINEWEELEEYEDILEDDGVNHLMINENKVLSYNQTEGVSVEFEELKHGVSVNFTVEEGVKLSKPVHLCFGVMKEVMEQLVDINFLIKEDAEVSVIAHCVFPNAERVVHKMNALIELEASSKLSYEEVHYHGEEGGVVVEPVAEVKIGEGAEFNNLFKLLTGKVGVLNFSYEVTCEDKSSAGLTAKVNARSDDSVKIVEKANLVGDECNALLNTRMVLNDEATGEVVNEITASGEDCRGHMDCVEVLNGGKARAKAVPIVDVSNDSSKVTHEAAIGSVDKDSINTLMSRGLTREEAINVVIKGLLE